MARTLIVGGTCITPDLTLPDHTLVIEDDRIAAIEPGLAIGRPGKDERVIDARGGWVIPGLIDLHVHGSAGSDTMDATPAALHTMARYFARHGVTAYLPTTISAPAPALAAAVANAAGAEQPEDGAQHLGIHLEGPYLSADHRGAQPLEALRDPDPAEYRSWFQQGIVRLVTVAPELPGALEMVQQGVAQGIHFSVGHSQADYDQVCQAADCGLSHATHTFNGMVGIHHRRPGTAGAVLVEDRIFAEVVADGIHLHPAIARLVVRAKGVDRTLLVTDAIRAAGLADGDYDLGGQTVNVREGIARTDRGRLAGSTLTLDRAVRNILTFAGLTLNQAVAMATRVPAQHMGWSGKKGALQAGADADVVLLDSDLNVHATLVAGRLVYTRPE